jgi:DNA polymerase-3 subunit alpha
MRKVNKRVIEGLIKGGALSNLPGNRAQQMAALEKAMEDGTQFQKEEEAGQVRLFLNHTSSAEDAESPAGTLPDLPEWDEALLLKNEKEALGFYISSHPLSRFEQDLKKYFLLDSAAVEEKNDGEEVRMAGLITGKKIMKTKKGDSMAVLKIEDLCGTLEGVLFPDLYKSSSHLLESEQPLIFSAVVDKGEKGVKLKLTKIEKLQSLPKRTAQIEILLDAALNSEGDIASLKELISRFPGEAPVNLRLVTPERKEYTIALGSPYHFLVSEHSVSELSNLFGREKVNIIFVQETA